MNNDYVFLTQKEEMWARMLIEVLEDNHVPCAALPLYGAALALKTGRQDSLRIFVSPEKLQQAQELLDQLFSENSILEDDFPDA